MTLYTLPAVRRKDLHLMLHQPPLLTSPLKYSLYIKAKVSFPRDRTANKASGGKQSLLNWSALQRYKKPTIEKLQGSARVFFLLRGQDRASKCWASSTSQSRIPEDHRRRSGRETLAPSKLRMVSSKQPLSDNGTASLKVQRSRVLLSLSTSGDRSFL